MNTSRPLIPSSFAKSRIASENQLVAPSLQDELHRSDDYAPPSMDFVGHDEGHITESTRHQILQLSRNSKYSRQRQREAEMHSDIVRIHDENEKMRSELEALNRRLEEARAQARRGEKDRVRELQECDREKGHLQDRLQESSKRFEDMVTQYLRLKELLWEAVDGIITGASKMQERHKDFEGFVRSGIKEIRADCQAICSVSAHGLEVALQPVTQGVLGIISEARDLQSDLQTLQVTSARLEERFSSLETLMKGCVEDVLGRLLEQLAPSLGDEIMAIEPPKPIEPVAIRLEERFSSLEAVIKEWMSSTSGCPSKNGMPCVDGGVEIIEAAKAAAPASLHSFGPPLPQPSRLPPASIHSRGLPLPRPSRLPRHPEKGVDDLLQRPVRRKLPFVQQGSIRALSIDRWVAEVGLWLVFWLVLIICYALNKTSAISSSHR